ncbi:hypothetical protein [Haloprofundus salinisoli]|nr:hypothetical protein [Haloprofundus salinisoli]
MADRQFTHVCRHCGVVMATTSQTPPRQCIVCEDSNFSMLAAATM